MPFSLDDLKLSKWIRQKMFEVTVEDLAKVRPGDPAPNNAKMAGILSDTLKAFRFVLESLDEECTQEFDALIPGSDEVRLTQPELAQRRACMTVAERARWDVYVVLQARVDALHGLFLVHLRAEFPELQSFDCIDYDEKFRVFGVNFSNEFEEDTSTERPLQSNDGGRPRLLH